MPLLKRSNITHRYPSADAIDPPYHESSMLNSLFRILQCCGRVNYGFKHGKCNATNCMSSTCQLRGCSMHSWGFSDETADITCFVFVEHFLPVFTRPIHTWPKPAHRISTINVISPKKFIKAVLSIFSSLQDRLISSVIWCEWVWVIFATCEIGSVKAEDSEQMMINWSGRCHVHTSHIYSGGPLVAR